jgi:hypothetical protein
VVSSTLGPGACSRGPGPPKIVLRCRPFPSPQEADLCDGASSSRFWAALRRRGRSPRAQQAAMPVIGYFSSRLPATDAPMLAAFRQGLNDTDYVESKNVVIEFRWAEGQFDRLPALADDLVRRKVAVIVTSGGEPTARAAKAATSTIPIVFNAGGDPVESGLVASLSRPGGNLTGVTSILSTLVQASESSDSIDLDAFRRNCPNRLSG